MPHLCSNDKPWGASASMLNTRWPICSAFSTSSNAGSVALLSFVCTKGPPAYTVLAMASSSASFRRALCKAGVLKHLQLHQSGGACICCCNTKLLRHLPLRCRGAQTSAGMLLHPTLPQPPMTIPCACGMHKLQRASGRWRGTHTMCFAAPSIPRGTCW